MLGGDIMTSEYDKLVKLGHLKELLEKLDYELAGAKRKRQIRCSCVHDSSKS